MSIGKRSQISYISASVNLTHVLMETALSFLILSHSKKNDHEISPVVISYSEVSYEKHLSGKIETLYFQPVMLEPPELRVLRSTHLVPNLLRFTKY